MNVLIFADMLGLCSYTYINTYLYVFTTILELWQMCIQTVVILYAVFSGSNDQWICTSRMESSSVVQVMLSLSSSDVSTSIDMTLQVAKFILLPSHLHKSLSYLFNNKLGYMTMTFLPLLMLLAHASKWCRKINVWSEINERVPP